MFISGSVPLFKALVRKEFLYNLESHHNETTEAIVFGVSVVRGRGLGWNVLLPNGAMFWRIPLHALTHKETAPKVLLSQIEFWDCLSSTFTVHKFDYLKELDCIAKLKSGDEMKASYMFTIDFADLDNSLPSAHADIPSEHKCAHILKLDDGNFASMPNNRIIWRDASFVTKTLEEMPADYLTNTHVFSAEQDFVSSDDNYYFYDARKPKEEKPSEIVKQFLSKEFQDKVYKQTFAAAPVLGSLTKKIPLGSLRFSIEPNPTEWESKLIPDPIDGTPRKCVVPKKEQNDER